MSDVTRHSVTFSWPGNVLYAAVISSSLSFFFLQKINKAALLSCDNCFHLWQEHRLRFDAEAHTPDHLAVQLG